MNPWKLMPEITALALTAGVYLVAQGRSFDQRLAVAAVATVAFLLALPTLESYGGDR